MMGSVQSTLTRGGGGGGGVGGAGGGYSIQGVMLYMSSECVQGVAKILSRGDS